MPPLTSATGHEPNTRDRKIRSARPAKGDLSDAREVRWGARLVYAPRLVAAGKSSIDALRRD